MINPTTNIVPQSQPLSGKKREREEENKVEQFANKRLKSTNVPFYNGSFDVKGKADGYGDAQYPDGKRYYGFFLEGLPDGLGYIADENKCYSGWFKKGKADGRGELTFYSNGCTYDGEFKDDLADGFGTVLKQESDPNGKLTISRYTGPFKEGRMHGTGELRTSTGSYIVQWNMGSLVGFRKRQ